MMITSQTIQSASNQDLVTIRTLDSITLDQVKTLAQAIQAGRRAWDVQTIHDYDGYLSILVEPSVRDNAQKSLFISGTAQHLELFEIYDDNMTLVATFNDVGELSTRVLDLLAHH